MFDVVMKVAPLLMYFLGGYIFKHVFGWVKFVKARLGDLILQAVFYVGAPALVYTSILKVELKPSLFLFCFVSPAIVLVTLGLGFWLRRYSPLKEESPKTFAVVLLGSSIMNLGSIIGAVQSLYGASGLALVAIIDVFNGLMSFSVLYLIAVRFGHDTVNPRYMAKKLLVAPPLWALTLGITSKLSGWTPPSLVLGVLGFIGSFVGVAVLFALGLKFSPSLQKLKPLAISLVLRFVGGGLVGIAFVLLFRLHGLQAQIIMLATTAAMGFYSISIAKKENLDEDDDFATTMVSTGLLVGLAISPVIIWVSSYL